jgi:hypothetical protein
LSKPLVACCGASELEPKTMAFLCCSIGDGKITITYQVTGIKWPSLALFLRFDERKDIIVKDYGKTYDHLRFEFIKIRDINFS